MSSVDYKQKIAIIQFFIDLAWNLNTHDIEAQSNPQACTDLKVTAVKNLFGIVDELGLFNAIDDQQHDNMFKTWCKAFVSKSMLDHKFNAAFADYLISIIKIDHLFLESEMSRVLAQLHAENNMEKFLHAYLDANVKFRQLARLTHKLFELIKANTALTLPHTFYESYGSCLESYHVDNQTLVNIWKDINKSLETSGHADTDLGNRII